MDATVTDPLVGKLLDGRYRVEELIARGGMATVYRGVDTRLDRHIAIKVMHASFAEDPEFVTRFTREARSAARLSDPHVVSVFDQGIDDGVVFLVMEYIAGRTLRDLLTTRGRLNPREAINVMTPVVQALVAAHRSGLVHRDIKPENVLIGDDGRVRVTDFGLARAANASGSNNATRGVLMGTMAYLAPEQVSPGTSDERSDIYAAGIVLFELLTGQPPFDGEDSMAVAYRHVHEDVPAPSSIVAGVPAAIDEIVLAATRRNPADRPADAGALVALMQAAAPATSSTSSKDQLTVIVPLPHGDEGEPATLPVGTTNSRNGQPKNTAVTPLPGQPPEAIGAGGGESEPPKRYIKRRRARGVIALVVVVALAIGAGSLAWWLSAGSAIAVPTVAGKVAKQAEADLTALGFKVEYADEKFSEIVPKGDVISSDPEAGDEMAEGATVTLTVSKGPERYQVPDLVNKRVDVAKQLLRDKNLTIGKKSRDYSDTIAQGRIISTAPVEGMKVRPDTEVDLVISRGVEPVPVPSVVGDSLEDAREKVEAAGLAISVSDRKRSTSVAEGAIISQNPSSGVNLAPGSTVAVVVSLGPPMAEVPGVVLRSSEDAREILVDAGFSVKVVERCFVTCVGRVTDQNPDSGTQAVLGSTVTIYVV